MFALSLPLWVVAAKLYGLYDRDEEQVDRSRADDLIGVFHLVTVGSWLVFAFTKLDRPRDTRRRPPRALLGRRDPADRAAPLCRASAAADGTAAIVQNTMIVGAGEVGQLVARKLLEHPEYGINVVGFVDREPARAGRPARRSDDPRHAARSCRRSSLTRRRARDFRVLDRRTRGRPAAAPRAAASRRPDRDRPALLRRDRPGVDVHSVEGLPIARAARRSGSSGRRSSSSGRSISSSPAWRWSCSRRSSRSIALADQARLARPGVLPAGADGRGRPAVPDLEVPDDGRRRRRAEARDRAPEPAPSAATRACSRSPDDPRVTRVGRLPAPLLARRAAAALQRRSRAR